jgi:hypothetical protein
MSDINLLTDYADLEPFAKEVKRTVRTVYAWMKEPDGLPYTRIGNRILIHIPTAREWLFNRMRRPNPPRPTRRRRQHSETRDAL